MIHLEVAVAAPLEQTLTYCLAVTKDQGACVKQPQSYVG